MDIIPFLAEILKSSKDCDFDSNNNSNSNKNSSTYHDNDSTHSRKNVLDSKKNVLDYEVDIASNALLTALKNICNVHKIFRTVPALIAKCNLCDTLSFMRGRLIQTRLKSVQNGILGQWMILSLVWISLPLIKESASHKLHFAIKDGTVRKILCTLQMFFSAVRRAFDAMSTS